MYSFVMMDQDSGTLISAGVETLDEAIHMQHRTSMSDRIAYWSVILDEQDRPYDAWFLPILRITDEEREHRKDLATRFVRVLREDESLR